MRDRNPSSSGFSSSATPGAPPSQEVDSVASLSLSLSMSMCECVMEALTRGMSTMCAQQCAVCALGVVRRR